MTSVVVAPAVHSHSHRYPTRSKFRPRESTTVTFTIKRRKRVPRRSSLSLNLSNDVLFKIMLLLPAKLLHDVIRYVCKEWCTIVKNPSFVRAHFENSSSSGISGMLVQHRRNKQSAIYVEFDTSTGLFELTKLRIPMRGVRIIASCDGFVLVRDETGRRPIFHVLNLVTNAKMSLPPIEQTQHDNFKSITLSVTNSGQYKVVHVSAKSFTGTARVMVYILGVDRDWRLAKLVSMPATKNALLFNNPHSIRGFIYWMHEAACYCAVMDVDTETIHHFPPPEGFNMPVRKEFPIYMERSFGLFVFCEQSSVYVIWELDLKVGKWIKVVDIDLFALSKRLTTILKDYAKPKPSCLKSKPLFFKDGLLWFTVSGLKVQPLVAYNISKDHFLICPVNRVDVHDDLFPHVNTILSVKNC